MFKLLISLLCCNTVWSQIDGEFWWLNEKLAQLHNIAPPEPKFDDVSDAETDESVKIVFKEDFDNAEYDTEGNNFRPEENTKMLAAIHFIDKSELSGPDEDLPNSIGPKETQDTLLTMGSNETSIASTTEKTGMTTGSSIILSQTEDVLNFIFPNDNQLDSNDTNKKVNYKENTLDNKTDESRHVSFRDNIKIQDSESICSFMKTIQCVSNRGFPYSFNGRPLLSQKVQDRQIVCCILPLKAYDSSRILFPDSRPNHFQRHKRSDNHERETQALRQRNALLRRKYQSQPSDSKTPSTTARTVVTQRIVTPEDYLDPYWNIKNSKFRNPAAPESESSQTDSKYDYSNQEYADEVPKPGGLLGLYSDHKNKGWTLVRPNAFSYIDTEEISEEGEDGDFSLGYSTIDPRLDIPMAISASKRKPSRIKIPSKDVIPLASNVISFRSKPDFQVLQGFKLLNLVENKSRFVRRTTSSYAPYISTDREPTKSLSSYNADYEDIDLDQQVYRNCGTRSNNIFDSEDLVGEVERDSQPWLALLVLTRNRQSILCYATLVHPRAAVTAADCVYGTAAGEVSVIAGIFDLSEDNTKSQHRVATVITHPQYKPGKLSNNLAVLHWKRPLILGNRVHPACLSGPHVGDNCYFVGWGGYDEAIGEQPRWQRATILPPKVCKPRLSKLDVESPTDAFCVSAETAGSVTGVGGPLLCTNNEKQYIAGVAVWRDGIILTIPVLDWTARVVEEILN